MSENYNITELIPHRYPFLLVDKIVELEPGKRAVAVKNVTNNEWFFQGHFPEFPIMPGVLIVEALAQTACLAGRFLQGGQNRLGVFTKIYEIKFSRQVVPGDVLTLESEITNFKLGVGKARVVAKVGESIAVEGQIGFKMVSVK